MVTCLLAEESVDTPAAVQPDRNSCLVEARQDFEDRIEIHRVSPAVHAAELVYRPASE